MDFLKNRTNQIAIGVVILFVMGLGGYYLFVSSSTNVPEKEESSEAVVKTIDPEEIGLTMEVTPDKKKVSFKIEKAKGIDLIEYELVYEADLPPAEQLDGGEGRVTRQVSGEAEVPSSTYTYESEEIDLGSCSRNVCKYDQGVEKIDLTLKLTKGKETLQVQDSLEL